MSNLNASDNDFFSYRPNLHLVYISDAYADYLRDNGDSHVLWHEHETYQRRRIYVGGIEINGLKYYIPFQHPKGTEYIETEDGQEVVRKTYFSCHYILNKSSKVIARLAVDHMIPVPDEFVETFDIATMQDDFWRVRRVRYEAQWCRSHKDTLINSALFCHDAKFRTFTDPSKANRTARMLDYRKLERCAENWAENPDLLRLARENAFHGKNRGLSFVR